MQSPALEPALEALLLRLDPDADTHWRGATGEAVARLEELAGAPLPNCHRWLLGRMGDDMGNLKYATVDMSARRLIDAYTYGEVSRDPRYLLIGWCTDPIVSMHYYYDLEHPYSGDARVVRRDASELDEHPQFETLREMLAWSAFTSHRVKRQAQQCQGSLRARDGSIVPLLAPAMDRLGFFQPIETGDCCALFERDDLFMALSTTPGDESEAFHYFRLGGADQATLRWILGAISEETSLMLKVRAWEPPLPTSV